MTAESNDIMQTRLDVAEMKGMLTQALTDHGNRLSHLEGDNVSIHSRLGEKGKMLATHSEQIKNAEKAINVLENDNRSRRANGFALIAILIAGASLLLEFIPGVGV